jgi:hypothetical protein
MSLIPIMRPKLPSADRLAPYLKSIDASQSLYDKHLLNAEIELIRQRIRKKGKILGAGSGEGEGKVRPDLEWKTEYLDRQAVSS